MFEKDRWQEIFYALKKNKLRTILTAFGIFWGIFMLMIMLGAGTGLRRGAFQNLGDFAVNSCRLSAAKTTMAYKGFNKGRIYDFEINDLTILKNNIPEIESIAPGIEAGQVNVSRKRKVEAYSVSGDFPEINKIDPVTMTGGRFLNNLDILENRKVIVIGARIKEALFEAHENPIGEYLKVKGVYFKVIGSFESKHTGGWGNYQNQSIIMPLSTVQNTFNKGNRIDYIWMTAKPDVKVSFIENKAIRIIKALHDVAPEDEMAVRHFNIEEQFLEINAIFNGINLVLWIVGLGTLLAGVIGVSNIMLVVIRERTQEIGIMRAIGATPYKVTIQIFMESIFLTASAGYVGLFLGIGLVELIKFILTGMGAEIPGFYKPEVSLEIAFVSLAILVFCGILAGMLPARRAIAMKPIEAIRSEFK